MKNVVTSLIIAIIFVFYIGVRLKYKKADKYIDPELKEHIDDFRTYARLLNIDDRALDSIYYVGYQDTLSSIGLAYNMPHKKLIFINPKIKNDSTVLKIVMYHELFHLLDLDHELGGIFPIMRDSIDHKTYGLIYKNEPVFGIEVVRNFAKVRAMQKN